MYLLGALEAMTTNQQCFGAPDERGDGVNRSNTEGAKAARGTPRVTLEQRRTPDEDELVSQFRVMMVTGRGLAFTTAAPSVAGEHTDSVWIARLEGEPAGMIIANVFAPGWTWRGGTPQPEATAVIGYVTEPRFRRKGVATAMVCEIPQLAEVRSVLAAVDPANVASEDVLRNCGFPANRTGNWRATGLELGRRTCGDMSDVSRYGRPLCRNEKYSRAEVCKLTSRRWIMPDTRSS